MREKMPINRSETRITIKYRDEETARAVKRAIEPDNLSLPEEIEINCDVDGLNLIIDVKCSRSIGSLVLTLDDLLSCVQAAERALQELG